ADTAFRNLEFRVAAAIEADGPQTAVRSAVENRLSLRPDCRRGDSVACFKNRSCPALRERDQLQTVRRLILFDKRGMIAVLADRGRRIETRSPRRFIHRAASEIRQRSQPQHAALK